MNTPQSVVSQLNNTIDLLEQTATCRRQLVDTLLEILDERDTLIDELNCEINRLRRCNEAYDPTANEKRAD